MISMISHLKCIVQWHLVHSKCGCTTITQMSSSKTYSSPLNRSPILIKWSLYILWPLHNLLFVSIGLSILYVLQKWNHTISDCLYLTQLNAFNVHPYCSIYQQSVPYYGLLIFCHISIPHLVIHLSDDGPLDCFHILAIMTNTSMKSHISVSV